MTLTKKQKKYLRFFAKLIVTLGVSVWIIWQTDWAEVSSYLKKIRPWQILVYIILVIFGMIISAYKWKKLAEFKNINLPLRKFFSFYIAGTFINNFMPSFIGGDAYKAYQIGKKDEKYAEAVSTVMVDRFTGLFGAVILALFFALINLKEVLASSILSIAATIVFAFLLFNWLIRKLRNLPFWKKFSHLLPKKVKKLIKEILSYDRESGMIFKATIISFAFNIIGIALANYVLFLSLGVQLNFLNYLTVIFLISIVASVPVSINNIGVKEWAYITFFGIFGVPGALAVTVAILSRFIQMLISFFALPVYLKNKQS